ncbi:hypothetical protein A1O1_03531 [Capronia coronata CBS 617.96]|uniref:Asteroid domain-containing protein n=1 Tax=Capronia coronata CBS 617.96 TaxID=1182541 RepID=W9YL94_9EURO|nr:uncharacterized protein A1O1_03531 [Capronia coronata CBS 617.96]EXJ90430.1 hypothetical protein A1O1_03531 [Capronia coronata CBS 617.96]
MGIPRLSQDLQPYMERVILGKTVQTSPPHDATNIHSLILDGPSIVYYVYNKLLAYKTVGSSTSTAAAVPVPTYEEINQASHRFLDQLTSHGLEIENIFFDGGLPQAKRDTRLTRMERLRQQLDAYRKAHPESFPIVSSRLLQHQHVDLDKALWNTSVMATRKASLPAPPFMVASVIESLRGSPQWGDKVQLVPGEADLFCALAAKESGAAILTNDSDLAVHDLGSEGRIVLLQSIEKQSIVVTPTPTSPKETIVTALALNPSHMAERLDVTSLLRFGFERSIDHSLSVSMVRERARDDSRLEKYRAEYALFAEQYLASPAAAGPVRVSPAALNATCIDPRTAELIVDIADTPHIYLTPLVEDPSRDSSWSYGVEIRQLAYSLLATVNAKTEGVTKSQIVTEYARKGQRIAATKVTALSIAKNHDRVRETLGLLQNCVSSSTDNKSILSWYILAIRIIYQQKVDAGKNVPTLSQTLHLLGLTASSKIPVSWDEIHLLANAHAVLYSCRMLKQIMRYVLDHRKQTSGTPFYDQGSPAVSEDHSLSPGWDDDLAEPMDQLYERFELMPNIEALFLDVPHLRRQIRQLDLETRNYAITQLKGITGFLDETEQSPSSQTDEGLGSDHVPRFHEAGDIDQDWVTAKPKKKKRKFGQESNAATPSTRRANPFDLLMED